VVARLPKPNEMERKEKVSLLRTCYPGAHYVCWPPIHVPVYIEEGPDGYMYVVSGMRG
jgi:hypothetical protein